MRRFDYDMSILAYRGQYTSTFVKFSSGMIGCVTKAERFTLVSPQGWVTRAKPFNEGGLIHLPFVKDYVSRHEIVYVEIEYNSPHPKGGQIERYLPNLAVGSRGLQLVGDGIERVAFSLLDEQQAERSVVDELVEIMLAA